MRTFQSPALILGLGCLTACGGGESMRTSVTAGPAVKGLELKAELSYRSIIEHEEALGLSGSCRNSQGIYLVAERNARLFHVDGQGTVEAIPLEGLPVGLDLEGLACNDERFYISTESEDDSRDGDIVLVVELDEGLGKVVESLTLHYPDGMKAGVNQGLEGLCLAGDWLVASGEILRTQSSGARQAPILRQRIGESSTFLHWVNLSSSTGKISGIDCRLSGEAIEVFAVERHYEVSRVLHFELGEGPSKSETILDLAHLVRETENFESILVDDRGEVRLSNDNQYKTITGPSEETVLEQVPAFAR